MRLTTDRLAGTDTFVVISIGNRLVVAGRRYQIAAFLPAECPAGAVVVAGGITGAVIGNGLTVISRQQVFPLGITIGIGMAIGTGDVAAEVIGIGVGGRSNNRLRQLA